MSREGDGHRVGAESDAERTGDDGEDAGNQRDGGEAVEGRRTVTANEKSAARIKTTTPQTSQT